jgi:carbonic anhydrase
MKNKLFLVCPFSNMENFIHLKYGEDVFFISAMATHAHFHDAKYLESVIDFISNQQIGEIYIVNDTSCRFLNAVLNGDSTADSTSEKSIQQLLVDNYAWIMQQRTRSEQLKILANLNIKKQTFEIRMNERFSSLILQYNIGIKGLITTKSENEIVEIKWDVYEF